MKRQQKKEKETGAKFANILCTSIKKITFSIMASIKDNIRTT